LGAGGSRFHFIVLGVPLVALCLAALRTLWPVPVRKELSSPEKGRIHPVRAMVVPVVDNEAMLWVLVQPPTFDQSIDQLVVVAFP
jgi:hypothetical protein